MKKAIYNKAGTKQIIDTGFKKFDKATNIITTGNVIANTQYSNFIRPYNMTLCNGVEHPKGHLMNYDLKHFNRVSSHIMEIIKDTERKNSVILYEFFIGKDTIGHVLCNSADHYISYDVCFNYGCQYLKRSLCINKVIEYITYDGKTEIPDDVKKELIKMCLDDTEKCTAVVNNKYNKYILHYQMLDTQYPEFPKRKLIKYSPMYVSVYDKKERDKYGGEWEHVDNVIVDWEELL